MTKYFCDFCGVEKKEEEDFFNIQLGEVKRKDFIPFIYKQYTSCADCQKRIKEFTETLKPTL